MIFNVNLVGMISDTYTASSPIVASQKTKGSFLKC